MYRKLYNPGPVGWMRGSKPITLPTRCGDGRLVVSLTGIAEAITAVSAVKKKVFKKPPDTSPM